MSGSVPRGKVVNVDFYEARRLPDCLAKDARKQGMKLESGIISVKTLIGSPPTYSYEYVGKTPEEVRKYMTRLAKDDGIDLSDAVKKAFSED